MFVPKGRLAPALPGLPPAEIGGPVAGNGGQPSEEGALAAKGTVISPRFFEGFFGHVLSVLFAARQLAAEREQFFLATTPAGQELAVRFPISVSILCRRPHFRAI